MKNFLEFSRKTTIQLYGVAAHYPNPAWTSSPFFYIFREVPPFVPGVTHLLTRSG